MSDKQFPALFSMDCIGKDGEYEADSRLLFCSAVCRSEYLRSKTDPEFRPDVVLTTADRPFYEKDNTTTGNVVLLGTDHNDLDDDGICNHCGKQLEPPEVPKSKVEQTLEALLADDNISASELADAFRTIMVTRLDWGCIAWDQHEEEDLDADDVAKWIDPCINRLLDLRNKASGQSKPAVVFNLADSEKLGTLCWRNTSSSDERDHDSGVWYFAVKRTVEKFEETVYAAVYAWLDGHPHKGECNWDWGDAIESITDEHWAKFGLRFLPTPVEECSFAVDQGEPLWAKSIR